MVTGVLLKLVVLKKSRGGNFYQTVGLVLNEEQHGRGPVHYAGRVGDVTIEVYPLAEKSEMPDKTTRLGFTVEKLTELIETLRNTGSRSRRRRNRRLGGCGRIVRDPDGRAVELYQR